MRGYQYAMIYCETRASRTDDLWKHISNAHHTCPEFTNREPLAAYVADDAHETHKNRMLGVLVVRPPNRRTTNNISHTLPSLSSVLQIFGIQVRVATRRLHSVQIICQTLALSHLFRMQHEHTHANNKHAHTRRLQRTQPSINNREYKKCQHKSAGSNTGPRIRGRLRPYINFITERTCACAFRRLRASASAFCIHYSNMYRRSVCVEHHIIL